MQMCTMMQHANHLRATDWRQGVDGAMSLAAAECAVLHDAPDALPYTVQLQ